MKSWTQQEEQKYVLNDNGKVVYYRGNSCEYYPYRWDYQHQRWYECSGIYTYRGIRRLEAMGKVKFLG